ncbi:MAG: hypothetical protein N2652_09450 [Kiritimatiellae bacterium]|nr:hypothetical protein [Kiritimatiellia bacterium]
MKNRTSRNNRLLSRREFLGGCAACAGCTALARPASAVTAAGARPRVRLVFAETRNDAPIWPNLGYDFDARRRQIISLLERECPGVEFLVARLMDKPEDADAVLASDADVQGYMICLQGLGWRNDVLKLCATGKPTLVVDNLYGGSGLFLTKQPAIQALKKPVDWVSSSRDEDIAASARQFALLAEGRSAEEVAAAFRRTRRERTWRGAPDPVAEDRLVVRPVEEALAELKRMKLLVVGRPIAPEMHKAVAETLGVTLVPIGFPELAAAYEAADVKDAEAFAERWIAGAQAVVEPSRDDITKAGRMYGAMNALMRQHGATGITINCLGGFYGGHLAAYPCLGFCQFNNDGLVGGCEGDVRSALTMMVMGALTGRPGYISDPVIDTARNAIIYAHCVAMTRPFGPQGAANPYRIRSHSEDRKGASLESLLPAGYLTTTIEIHPELRKMTVHQAVAIGCCDSDMACRTKLVARVRGDIEKLTEGWSHGWHRVTFYGDLMPLVDELCARWKFERVLEA